MNLILEFIIVSVAFWFVSNKMEGITMKKQETAIKAAAVYMVFYFLIKQVLLFLFAILTLGFMFGLGFVAIVLAGLGAMYMATVLVEDYEIESFPVLSAAVFVIAVISSILRLIIFYI